MTTVTDGAVRATVDADRALSRFSPRLDGDFPGWFTDFRQAGFDWAMEHGFPTRRDEDWKYTRLEAIGEVPFVPAAPGIDHRLLSTTIDERVGDLGGPRLVFVNGHFAPECSRRAALPNGTTVTSLASALAVGGEQLRWLSRRTPRPYRHAFSALNAAVAEDGALIRVPAGTIIDETIELAFFSHTGGIPLVSSPRSVILAGPDSAVTIVETHAGTHGDLYWSNGVVEVVLDEGACVEHYTVQDEAETAFHLALMDVRQAQGSRFRSHSVALGSSIARHEVHVSLEGEGSEVDLEGLYLPRGDQQHDNPILIEHMAPGCTSRQLYKGIVDGGAHGVFNGHIIVRPGAFGTDASQTNKNLLLSDHAEVDTRPRLEIFADDVQCTHGAAVGRLDEDALFYLRSRGIPEQEARGVLTYAFAREMVTRCPSAVVRARMEHLIADRLTTGANEPVMDSRLTSEIRSVKGGRSK